MDSIAGKTSSTDQAALDWIASIESEKGRVREGDIYPRLKAWVDLVSPSEILDIGCGQGICSDKIDLNSRHYTGIDPSPVLVDRAKQLYHSKNRRFLLGSAFQLPLADRAFDAAFSVTVWHLLDNLKVATSELSRVLKPNGHFLIITANPSASSLWTARASKTDVLHLHTSDEMLNSFQGAGLQVQKTETFRELFISIEGQKNP